MLESPVTKREESKIRPILKERYDELLDMGRGASYFGYSLPDLEKDDLLVIVAHMKQLRDIEDKLRASSRAFQDEIHRIQTGSMFKDALRGMNPANVTSKTDSFKGDDFLPTPKPLKRLFRRIFGF